MSLTFVPTATVFDADPMALTGAWGVAFASLGGNPYLYVSGNGEAGISGFAVSAGGELTNIAGANIHDSDNVNHHLDGAAGIASFSIGGTSYLCVTAFVENALSMVRLSESDGSFFINEYAYSDSASTPLSGAIDVVGVTVGGSPVIVAAGYNDNGISSFRNLALLGIMMDPFIGSQFDNSTFNLAGVRSLSTTVVGGTTYLVAAGQTDSGLSIFTIDSFGHLAPFANISDDASVNLSGAAAVTTANVFGETYIFAAGVFDHGLSVFHFQPGTTPTPVFNIGDNASLHLNEVYDLVTADIAGTTYLFAAGLTEDGVDAFAVAADGTLVGMGSVADTAALALNGAAQLATTVIGGHTYLAVTGRDDNGISLFRIDPAGFTITGTAGADLVDATHAPAHQLRPGDFGDTIFGLGGNDILRGLGGNDLLDGGADSDTLDGDAGADTMAGGAGNDSYYVDNAGDIVDETVAGSNGLDIVRSATVSINLADATHFKGAVENVALLGGAMLNLTGNALANTLIGNAGANTLNGGPGNDTLIGGPGFDRLVGGPGNDTYVLGNDANFVVDTGGTADLATTTLSRSMLLAGLATIEQLTLVSGNINGTGNNLANTIIGSTGNNIIRGGIGNDALFGGVGNDTLYGEVGIDRLTGGPGKDVFVFNVAPSLANRDVITDFNHADDTIKLSHSFFTGMGTGPLKATYFFAGSAAHDADDHIIYNEASGALFYDSDGTGAHAQVQFAVIANHATAGLAASDFVLV